MNKDVKYNKEARAALKQGVDILANAVKVTLGPKGRNVVINRDNHYPLITKDGVTVAKNVNVEDPLINTGVQIIKGVAEKTVEIAGDGTTTATVLAQEIITLGIEAIDKGGNPMAIKRGIDIAVAAAVESIKEQSRDVEGSAETLKNVALISTNNDIILGGMIAEAMHRVGKYGTVNVEHSSTSRTELKFDRGFTFDRGWEHNGFITNQIKRTVEFDNPWILLYDKKISNLKELVGVLEIVAQSDRPILIIADDFEREAINVLGLNNQKGIRSVPVKAPSYGELRSLMMEDIAILTGGTVIKNEDISLKRVNISYLGQADKVVVEQNKTIIIGGRSNKQLLDDRTDELEKSIEVLHSEDDKTAAKTRLSNMKSSVATIYVGAATELEVNEKMDRIDDAVHATRAAVEEGIVPGGGVAYIRAAEVVDKIVSTDISEQAGINIIYKALFSPLDQIVSNCGFEDVDEITTPVTLGSGDYGYNARTGEYHNLIENGVIDPTKVTRVALENAASIASMMLTTECLLLNLPK